MNEEEKIVSQIEVEIDHRVYPKVYVSGWYKNDCLAAFVVHNATLLSGYHTARKDFQARTFMGRVLHDKVLAAAEGPAADLVRSLVKILQAKGQSFNVVDKEGRTQPIPQLVYQLDFDTLAANNIIRNPLMHSDGTRAEFRVSTRQEDVFPPDIAAKMVHIYGNK